MTFKIAPHEGLRSPTQPANALDLLRQRLGGSREGASFAKAGEEIVVTWQGVDGDESVERGRRAILEIVRRVCEDAPELEFEWFAVFMNRRPPARSIGLRRTVSAESINEATVEVAPDGLKRARSHHEVAPCGWTLVADGRLYEDGAYRGELTRPVQRRGDDAVTIHYITI